MQKGVFTIWLKELCALVFLQTIQAFILAMVLSIILTFLKQIGTNVSEQAQVSALGVLCILLLASLTKMEQITKKIFGLDSGILQNKPPHGLMASFMALKAVGRVFNNVPKMIGGIGSATIGAATDKKKASATMLSRLNRKGLDKNGNQINGAAEAKPQINPPTGENNLLESNEYYNKAKRAKVDGNMDEYHKNMNIQAGINKAKKAMAENATVPSRLNKGVTSNNKAQDDYYKIMDKYNDEIAKATEKRKNGWKDAASGFNETLGAIAGGGIGLSVGSITGLATGDLDQIHKATAYGIGLGDAVGENVTKAASTVISGASSNAKARSNLGKQLDQMETNLKIQRKKITTQAKRVRNINQKIEKNMDLK